jgi:hypothetical protein
MLHHSIETCPDDHEALRLRLDELTAAGARILAVIWQPQRPDPMDQAAALASLGSYVIVSELSEETRSVLRPREAGADELSA